MRERMLLPAAVLLFLLATLGQRSASAQGSSYWVSPDGVAAWASCSGDVPLDGLWGTAYILTSAVHLTE